MKACLGIPEPQGFSFLGPRHKRCQNGSHLRAEEIRTVIARRGGWSLAYVRQGNARLHVSHAMFSFRGGRRLEGEKRPVTWKMGCPKHRVSQHAFPSSTCGESLSHTSGHLDIPHTCKKASDILSTIGMAGNDHWTELRRAA